MKKYVFFSQRKSSPFCWGKLGHGTLVRAGLLLFTIFFNSSQTCPGVTDEEIPAWKCGRQGTGIRQFPQQNPSESPSLTQFRGWVYHGLAMKIAWISWN